ncbi:Shedu immune nuclease family protein [Marinilabilia salmonicolor]|uniref:Uncharacterized protein DUF4263 n=1 Tax=Marinilabilia salmonicolor TaxID=989 RepID=A0A368UKA0_9BACT|nr:Shedu immune nuclease family protein [Marinilabilia salmonicolor]RCW23129.1 uncharacterized protein DUF4263 [Marinilabilia salmonicolor]
MNQIQETKSLLIFEEIKGSSKLIYRQHKEDETEEKVFIYKVTGDTYEYEFDGDAIKKIVFEGFSDLPGIIIHYGYGFQEKSLQNFFKYRITGDQINKLVITQDSTSRKSRKTLYLRLDELEDLLSEINKEQRACNDTKKILIKNYLVKVNPSFSFDHQETNNNKKLILRNLNQKLIDQLTADEIETIGKFYINAAQKYKRADLIKRMSFGLQKNAQILTLQEIIAKYETLLDSNSAESEWQSFFDEYITLFDTRYAHKLDYKNIATGITKYPDLVLVDIYGYIDFYELKKSGMPLIKYDSSHKTWYWTKDVAMVISQASDYLQKAKENGLSYSSTIKKITATEEHDGLEVNIINPRAIIVAGNSKMLNSELKRDHFKNLRESLKDIEFVLYDELLDRLKNLLDSIKLG